MLKYSRQRESIKEFLQDRTDHPTAETVYQNLKQDFPKISLGTVYRNLSLLSDLGEILKLSSGVGPDRFDKTTLPHYHLYCTTCNDVIDLEMESIDHINLVANHNFSGTIEGHFTYFYGTCEKCTIKVENSKKTIDTKK